MAAQAYRFVRISEDTSSGFTVHTVDSRGHSLRFEVKYALIQNMTDEQIVTFMQNRLAFIEDMRYRRLETVRRMLSDRINWDAPIKD